jgi:4-hydroxy-2-oxoheptanedioate aldolase
MTGHHVPMTNPSPLPPVPGFTDLRSRIQAGETLYGTFIQLGSPIAAELIARAGFDWAIIDLEHGAGTESELMASLLAVSTTPTTALVRPQSAERIRIGRALDHGAHGLMIPRIDIPEQAREAISFMRFPPDGVRGLALSTRGAGLAERGHADVRGINEHLVGIIQIESPSAVEYAAEIAAIDGVDVLFIGPADLSHSLGIPGQFDHPDYLDAVQRTLTAAERHGKATGILLRDAAALARHLELGFRFVGIGSDVAFIADGARAVVSATGS